MFYVSKSQIVSILIWLEKNPGFVQKNIYFCIKSGVDFDLILLCFPAVVRFKKAKATGPAVV